MGKQYKNSPLVEAVCEFRVNPEVGLDMTIPGLLYNKVKKSFPIKNQKIVSEVRLQKSDEGIRQINTEVSRVIFNNKTRTQFIQISPINISFHCLKPYPGWASLSKNIQKLLTALKSISKIKQFERIGIRYINNIEVPGDAFNLDDYFDYMPNVGTIENKLRGFQVMSEFDLSKARDTCRVTLGSELPSTKGVSNFVLDLDYYSSHPSFMKYGQATAWVNKAHDNLEEIFEKCITDKTRELFDREE